MASEKLDRAIQLVKAGNRKAALPLLKDVIREEPRNENAWLWLYACVEKVEEKKYCLQKALEINPNNFQARTALEKLSNPVRPSQATISSNVSESTADRGTGKRLLGITLIAVFFMALCLIVPLFYFFQTGKLNTFAAPLLGLPSATLTPTSTALPTATASFTPSPRPTLAFTATRRPSATLIEAFASPLPPLTAAAFTPGDPTATPLGSDIADVNFQKGLAAYKAKQYASVIELMSAVIQANPDLAPPYRHRALAYYYLRQCARGLPDIEKALSIDPNYASAWAGRGSLNLCLGNDRQAIPDLQKALSLDASLSVARLNLGVAYFHLGNYEKSLEEYTLAAEIDPSRAAAWTGRSDALFRLGQYAECIESATKAIEINASEWIAYTDRANCEIEVQKYTEAVNDYTVYIDANSGNNQLDPYYINVAYFHRGDANLMLEKYVEAVRDYEMAKPSMDRNDAHFYCQLSYAYFGAKRYQDALEAADTSISINLACGGQKLLVTAARSAFALGDNDRALGYVDKAISLPDTYPLAYYYRAVILQKMGNKAEAIESLKRFLSFAPKGPEADDTQVRLNQLLP